MRFNDHWDLKDQHAFLSASKYHWLNYSEEKLIAVQSKFLATQRGTELHKLACDLIKLGVRLPRTNKTLNLYVNDAIGFKMVPEQILYYSENCFGTADAIAFRQNFLRIHDLKTGESKTSMHQLEIYSGLFCLEYGFRPTDIQIELRIYQFDTVLVHNPDPDRIVYIMNKIVSSDKILEQEVAG